MSFQIEYVIGDVFAGEHAPVMAHGCNTQGIMGGVVAAVVAGRYPHIERGYKTDCAGSTFVRGSAVLYGTMNTPLVGIYNLGTQIQPGANAEALAIYLAFMNLYENAAARGFNRIAIPRIGCGIGGLTWITVRHAIETAAHMSVALANKSISFPQCMDHDLTLVVHDLTETDAKAHS